MALGHTAALAAGVAAGLTAGWTIAIAILVLVNAAWVARRHVLLVSKHALIRLEICGETDATLYFRDGAQRAARVLGSSYVTRWMIVVRLDQAGRLRVRTVVIVADAVSVEAFRRLRVRLRWAKYSEMP